MLGVGSRSEVPAALGAADRAALAVLVSVQGLGPVTLERLVTRIGSPQAVLALAGSPGGERALVEATSDPEGAWRSIPDTVAGAVVAAARTADEILRDMERHEVRTVVPGDPEYPRRLREIELPPAALFARGDLGPLHAQRVVAMVGTRRPTEAGRRIASRIGAAIARADGTVVSGLAVGIDGAAHAAVVAEGRPTVAFIGSGHGCLFPRAHHRLADAIVEGGGAVVSEYTPRTEPTRGTFPRRNRLISGSADAVVVVEAGARSGALLTASWALEQGRECFLVPGSIEAPMSAGCLGFLRDWPSLARIVAGVPQLLDDLGLAATAALEPSRRRAPSSTVRVASPTALLGEASKAEHQVADALIAGAATVDELVATTGLTVAAVLGTLTKLEASGLALGAHGRYRPAGGLAAADPPRPGRSAGRGVLSSPA
jgi:DNA processing protein